MRYRFQSGEQVVEVGIEREGERLRALVDGQEHILEVLDAQPGLLTLSAGGRAVTLYWAVDSAGRKWFSMNGCTYCLERPHPKSILKGSETPGGEVVRAPMPAQVRAVQVVVGDRVEKGDTLLLLEAMKMEIRVRAPRAGRVARLLVSSGQTVEKEQVLAEIGE